MRPYETAFLIAPNLPDEEADTLIEKMAGIITKKKGKMINTDKWGKRKLAYPIQSFEEALYVFFQYEGEPNVPAELERNFKQTESIIRYLTVKLDERENIHRKKKAKTRAAAVEEERISPVEEEAAAEEPKPLKEAPPAAEEEEAKPAGQDKEENEQKEQEQNEESREPEKTEEEVPEIEAKEKGTKAKDKEE